MWNSNNFNIQAIIHNKINTVRKKMLCLLTYSMDSLMNMMLLSTKLKCAL